MKPKYVLLLCVFCTLGLFQSCNNKCDHKEQENTHYYSGTQIYFSFADSSMTPIKLKHMKKDLALYEAEYSLRSTEPLVVALGDGETVDFSFHEMELSINPKEAYNRMIAFNINEVIIDNEENLPCTSGQLKMHHGRLLDEEGRPIDSVKVYDVRRPDIVTLTDVNARGEYSIELEIDDECKGVIGIIYRDKTVCELKFQTNLVIDFHMDDTHHKLRSIRQYFPKIIIPSFTE